jgi:hypothetical protein
MVKLSQKVKYNKQLIKVTSKSGMAKQKKGAAGGLQAPGPSRGGRLWNYLDKSYKKSNLIPLSTFLHDMSYLF